MNNNDKKKCLRQEFECRQVNFVKRDIEKKLEIAKDRKKPGILNINLILLNMKSKV